MARYFSKRSPVARLDRSVNVVGAVIEEKRLVAVLADEAQGEVVWLVERAAVGIGLVGIVFGCGGEIGQALRLHSTP